MEIVEVDTRVQQQVRMFLDLPFRLYRHMPQWVPPFAGDARRMLDRRRHPFYKHSDAAFYLALDGRQAVGRLAVLENRNYNTFNRSAAAFFYLFECENDVHVSNSLFDAAFSWAHVRGLSHIEGPRGFTALDGLGLLSRGFEHRPALGIPYNPSYYPTLVEAAGFQGIGDVLSGYLRANTPFPDRIHRVAELVQARRGLRVGRFRTRRDLRALVPRLRELYNTSIQNTVGNVPLTEDEVHIIATQMLAFADPRLIKVVMKGEGLVGFLFAYPDVSAALQRCKGRLLPLGWIDLLLELKRTKWVNVNGAGIVEKYRGLGGTALLFSEMCKSIIEGGFEHADIVQIGAENDNMQRELRGLGIDFYKTHRMYGRPL